MIFITGGARSGKSSFAEELAAGRGQKVTYLATASPGDAEMRERIESHRHRRPEAWKTVEVAGDLAGAIRQALKGSGTVLVDCITVYLAGLMQQMGDSADGGLGGDSADGGLGGAVSGGASISGRIADTAEQEVERLVDVCRSGNGRVIIVGNEVGMGIVPGSPLGRAFRDVAGRANQKLAAAADEVYLCVSGIPLKVK
ncbi:MAG: bifunctional adenosylcobinamide kinase/adenosylcobinamide-phosphate guanylyltransferase [Actinomycetota bacterium]